MDTMGVQVPVPREDDLSDDQASLYIMCSCHTMMGGWAEAAFGLCGMGALVGGHLLALVVGI